MKHSDFYFELQLLKAREVTELCAAIDAHGGKVSFTTERDRIPSEVDAPVIMFNLNNIGPADITIKEVSIVNGCLQIKGYEEAAGGHIKEYYVGDVLPGQLEYVIDQIPETDSVKDVTVKKSIAGKLEDILNTLDGIIKSGYIPFASPSPSSTEKVVKQSIKNAKAELERALECHNDLYKN